MSQKLLIPVIEIQEQTAGMTSEYETVVTGWAGFGGTADRLGLVQIIILFIIITIIIFIIFAALS